MNIFKHHNNQNILLSPDPEPTENPKTDTSVEQNTDNKNQTVSDFDNYFENLLKQESTGKPVLPETQEKPKTISKNGINDFLAEYNLNSMEELEDLKLENPDLYYEINSSIMLSKVSSKQQEQLNQFKESIYLDSMLQKAKQEGINEKDFTAFAKYYQMPVNDKTLELYKKQIQKPNKTKIEEINNISNIQKQTPQNIDNSKVNTESNYISKTKDIINRI